MSGINMAELGALIESMPADVAGSFIEKLKLAKAAADAVSAREKILADVKAVLKDTADMLSLALPAGRTLRILHVPAKVADGKEVSPACLSFDVEMPGGLTSYGGNVKTERTARGGGIVRATLDGVKVFEGSSFKSVFVALVEFLHESKDKDSALAKVPESNYAATREIDSLARKLKGRLVVAEVEETKVETKVETPPETK